MRFFGSREGLLGLRRNLKEKKGGKGSPFFDNCCNRFFAQSPLSPFQPPETTRLKKGKLSFGFVLPFSLSFSEDQ